jgi:gamma-glutamylcyclotransferase (GGCT)/AIG2-like uncharacterized protein YtfP
MPLLFSYGTLQQRTVQMALFGRLLEGEPDELIGFEQSVLTLDTGTYAIAQFNGRSDSRVRGTVYELSDAEIATADGYETADYKRIKTTLVSGKQAWVYADARFS